MSKFQYGRVNSFSVFSSVAITVIEMRNNMYNTADFDAAIAI